MSITEHLALRKMTPSTYAARIGVNQSTIFRACKGAIPTPATMLAIAKESGFRVLPIDFYPEVKAAAARHRKRKPK